MAKEQVLAIAILNFYETVQYAVLQVVYCRLVNTEIGSEPVFVRRSHISLWAAGAAEAHLAHLHQFKRSC